MTWSSIFSLKFLERGGVFPFPAKVVPAPEGGIIAIPWFKQAADRLAAARGNMEKVAKGPVTPKPKKPRKGKPAHKKLHIKTHPILAESFFKAGAKRLRKAKESCDSSTNTPNLVAKPKVKETAIKFGATFREAAASDDATKFRVVLIEEGLGNFKDAFYYTSAALESAAPIFNGLKIYADHPTEEEEEIRPERSTRDILGHYENLDVEEGQGGQHQLCGDLDILSTPEFEWARALMLRAIENASKFPDRNFIGLSINASGDAQATPIEEVIEMAPEGAKAKLLEAQEQGIDTVKVVHKINRATSCDLVTEAGAGGKILNIIEGEDNDGD